MPASDLDSYFVLAGRYGPTMTMEDVRAAYFPSVTTKTMQNKASSGLLPPKAGHVFDTRDVADWWEALRSRAHDRWRGQA